MIGPSEDITGGEIMTTEPTTGSTAKPEEVNTEPNHGNGSQGELIAQILDNGALTTGRYVKIPVRIESTRETKTLDTSCVTRVPVVDLEREELEDILSTIMVGVEDHYESIANAIFKSLSMNGYVLVPGANKMDDVWTFMKKMFGTDWNKTKIVARKEIEKLYDALLVRIAKTKTLIDKTKLDKPKTASKRNEQEMNLAKLAKRIVDDRTKTYDAILAIGRESLDWPETWTPGRFAKIRNTHNSMCQVYGKSTNEEINEQENFIRLLMDIRSAVNTVSKFIKKKVDHRKIAKLPARQYLKEMYSGFSHGSDYGVILKKLGAYYGIVPRDDITPELREKLFAEVISSWNVNDDQTCHIRIEYTGRRAEGEWHNPPFLRCEIVGLDECQPLTKKIDYTYTVKEDRYILYPEDDVVTSVLEVLAFQSRAQVLSHHLNSEPMTEDAQSADSKTFHGFCENTRDVPYRYVNAHLISFGRPKWPTMTGKVKPNELPGKIDSTKMEKLKYSHLDSRTRRMVRSALRPQTTADTRKPRTNERAFNPALHIPLYQSRPGIVPTGAPNQKWSWNHDPSNDDGTPIAIGLQLFTKMEDRQELITRHILNWERVVEGRIDKILRTYGPLFETCASSIVTASNLKRLLKLEVLEFAMSNSPYTEGSKFHRRNKAPQLYAVFRNVDVNVAVRSTNDRRIVDGMKQGEFSQCLIAVENKELWPWISGCELEWLSGTLKNEDLIALRHTIGKQDSYCWGQTMDAIILRAYHKLRSIEEHVVKSSTVVHRRLRIARNSYGDVRAETIITQSKAVTAQELILEAAATRYTIPVFTVSRRNLSDKMWEDPGFVIGSVNRTRAIELSKLT
jgi:hypothetical protein